MSAPDLAVVRESMPATPASSATSTVNVSGWEMNRVAGRLCSVIASGAVPVARRISTATKVTAMATGKPTASAIVDRRASSPRRSTRATQTPASGPNSGPTTIAPMISTTESVRMPMAAIRVAITMKASWLPDSSALSDVVASTSSQITASEAAPLAACEARRAPVEIVARTSSIEIEPSRSTSSWRSCSTTTLTSSRATSHSTRSPGGFSDAPGTWTTLTTARESVRTRRTASLVLAGTTRRRWTSPASGETSMARS